MWLGHPPRRRQFASLLAERISEKDTQGEDRLVLCDFGRDMMNEFLFICDYSLQYNREIMFNALHGNGSIVAMFFRVCYAVSSHYLMTEEVCQQ